jgi:hypothetical protein
MTSEQFVAMPKNLVYLGIYSCICDLYTISLLASSMLANLCETCIPTSTASACKAIRFQTSAQLGQWNSARARLRKICFTSGTYIPQTTTVQDDVCLHLPCLSNSNLSDIWLQKYRNFYVVPEPDF